MPRIPLNTPAPPFSMLDMRGERVSLSDFHSQFNILLVFNRGFT